MLLRFPDDVVALRPDYVIIMGGTNDAFSDVLPDEVGENIVAMIILANQWGIIPLIGLPPPVDFPEAEVLLVQAAVAIQLLADLK